MLLIAVAMGTLHLVHRYMTDALFPIFADLHIVREVAIWSPLPFVWALDHRALKRTGAGAFYPALC